MHKQYLVRLTEQEREQLDALIRKGKSAAYKIKHANILLKADADGVAWNDAEIAAACAVHPRTVAGMRERVVEHGLAAALHPTKQERPPQQPPCAGEAEAHRIAGRCSEPLPGKNFQSIKINRLQNIVDIDSVAIVTNKLLYSYKKSEQAFCMDFLGRYYEKL